MGSQEQSSAKIEPALSAVEQILGKFSSNGPNIVPLCASLPADLLTPTLAYLKLSNGSQAEYSFLFESAATTETIGRYSFVGASRLSLMEKSVFVLLMSCRSEKDIKNRTRLWPGGRSPSSSLGGTGTVSRGLHTVAQNATACRRRDRLHRLRLCAIF